MIAAAVSAVAAGAAVEAVAAGAAVERAGGHPTKGGGDAPSIGSPEPSNGTVAEPLDG